MKNKEQWQNKYNFQISGRYRLEMTPSADTDESEVLSPRRNLEEEYLTYEAKVCM